MNRLASSSLDDSVKLKPIYIDFGYSGEDYGLFWNDGPHVTGNIIYIGGDWVKDYNRNDRKARKLGLSLEEYLLNRVACEEGVRTIDYFTWIVPGLNYHIDLRDHYTVGNFLGHKTMKKIGQPTCRNVSKAVEEVLSKKRNLIECLNDPEQLTWLLCDYKKQTKALAAE